MSNKIYLYAVRDLATGKLVNGITNPGRKFWEKKGSCLDAIKTYNTRASYFNRKHYEGPLKLVTYELNEVIDNG